MEKTAVWPGVSYLLKKQKKMDVVSLLLFVSCILEFLLLLSWNIAEQKATCSGAKAQPLDNWSATTAIAQPAAFTQHNVHLSVEEWLQNLSLLSPYWMTQALFKYFWQSPQYPIEGLVNFLCMEDTA